MKAIDLPNRQEILDGINNVAGATEAELYDQLARMRKKNS